MSLRNAHTGHGQMSCNPEAHDYLGFGAESPPLRPPVHDPRQPKVALPMKELMSLSEDELRRRYYDCVRNCTLAEQQRIECGLSSITTADSPKLATARQLYEAWQAKAVQSRSVRTAQR